MKKSKTYNIQIFVTGNINRIETICSKFCSKYSICVNISPRKFIYNKGMESGLCIEFINYAKYQDKNLHEILNLAKELAIFLVNRCYQKSCTIITPETTYYYEANN